MKTNLTPLFLFLAITSFAQTIRRVNNNPGITGAHIYTTLQAAHDAAASGDTIYVEGSTTAYGGLTCTKPLTLIGPGYFLDENFTNYPDVRAALPGTINFNTGSEGSAVYGMAGNGTSTINVRVSNITISRNISFYIYLPNVTDINNVNVTKNYDVRDFDRNGGSGGVSISILNNHITGSINLTGNITGSFSNNIIMWFLSLSNFTVSNNIILIPSVNPSPSFTNCTFSNNIDARATTGSTAFGTTNGNLGNVNSALLFQGLTGNTTDGQYRLATGSPAIGAGVGGTNCGIFGGIDPYVLSGIYAAPQILRINSTPSGSNTTPLSVTVDIKSNN